MTTNISIADRKTRAFILETSPCWVSESLDPHIFNNFLPDLRKALEANGFTQRGFLVSNEAGMQIISAPVDGAPELWVNDQDSPVRVECDGRFRVLNRSKQDCQITSFWPLLGSEILKEVEAQEYDSEKNLAIMTDFFANYRYSEASLGKSPLRGGNNGD